MDSLRQQLKEKNVSQVYLAKELNVSKTAINLALNGEYPKEKTFKGRFYKLLHELGVECQDKTTKGIREDSENMLIQKQTLTQQAMKKFQLPYEIFGDLEAQEQVYSNNNISYIRECLLQNTLKGKMSCLIGESGSGKTTLVDDLEQNLVNSVGNVVFIRPSPIGIAENSNRGNVLKASHICDAILLALDEEASLSGAYQKKVRVMHKNLISSYKSGKKICVVLEEAHLLHTHTLKNLKSLNEIKVGFDKVVSVILVGQQELEAKLDGHNTREVSQRMLFYTLEPIADIEEYLLFVCASNNVPLGRIIDESGIKAFEARMFETGQSTAYPLAINNNMIKAINLAASMGSIVNADVVKYL